MPYVRQTFFEDLDVKAMFMFRQKAIEDVKLTFYLRVLNWISPFFSRREQFKRFHMDVGHSHIMAPLDFSPGG